MVRWTPLEELPPDTETPACYTWTQLARTEIEELIRGILCWYPDISVGSGRCFVDPLFYEERTSLLGEIDKDIIVYVGKFEGNIISVLCLERFIDSLVICGRFGACASEHRGTGSALFAGYAMDQQALSMGFSMVYSHVTLKNPSMQWLLERAGFRPIGIMPCADRELVAPGEIRHVNEILYAKVYADAPAIASVNRANMTKSVRALWDHLCLG